jgi:hypothetical protein
VPQRQHAPHKKRVSEWTNPGLIGIGVVLLLIGTPMVLWLMTYHSDAAVIMFIVTWLSLTVFVLLMAKSSVSDAGYFIDKKVISRTRQEIAHQRRLVRKELFKNEIDALRRREKTPVLDIWRLDESLAKRHSYFTSATSLLIDPQQKELQVRIQVGEIGTTDAEKQTILATVFANLVVYLRIVSEDAYLGMLREFFDDYILEIDAIRENEQHVDTPYPILSLSMKAPSFWSIGDSPSFDKRHLFELAEVRFDNGIEVQPHRVIDLPSARGLK